MGRIGLRGRNPQCVGISADAGIGSGPQIPVGPLELYSRALRNQAHDHYRLPSERGRAGTTDKLVVGSFS
jgi:hypothetical protein